MARRTALRASDEDREHVAERLRNATAEGRLLTEELEERLGTVFSARTYGELDAVTADLPAPYEPRRKTPLWVRATFALAVVMAVLAVIAMVALVVVGLAGAWMAWMVLAWVFFGRGRGRRGGLGGHSRTDARAFRCARAGARAPRGGPASSL
jgi:hypothetical protein